MLATDHVSTMSDRVRDPPSSVVEVLGLLSRRGDRRYAGEPVSHREHALQCASLAVAEGAAAPLVSACLLHDVGHLLADGRCDGSADGDPVATPTLSGIDDGHERTGPAWLGRLFPSSVLQPIRWHVDAKRYLAAAEPGYLATLSEDSRRSLALQGGPLTADEAALFLARPWAQEAIRLRRWDDAAKVPGARTLPLEELARWLDGCVRLG
jgi:phosphonate degradation associated HDIG domain protein